MSATLPVEVPTEAGTDEGTGLLRLSSLRQVRAAHLAALAGVSGLVITIGGDCGADLAGVQHAAAMQDAMALVWIGAHGNLFSPQESPTGAFHGMVLRTLLGEGPAELVAEVAVPSSRVVLAGTRALDNTELAYIDRVGMKVILPEKLNPGSLTAALEACGATSVYLHIDLDVLDPAGFGSVGYPEPFGISLDELLALIDAAKAALPLVGAAVTEFAPSSADAAASELGSILRIIGALAR